MVESFVIYTILIVVSVGLAEVARRSRQFGFVIYALVLYAMLFGVRYDVGVDYLQYLFAYQQPEDSFEITRMEIGFRSIILTFKAMGLHFTLFFAFVAFLQLFLVFRSVKEVPEVYPFLMASFMLGCIWLSYANGLRQILSVTLFVMSLYYTDKKKIILTYLFILLAVLMHKSAMILVVFYPLFAIKRVWFSNVKNQVVLFLIALILSNVSILDTFTEALDDVAAFLGYDYYMDDSYQELREDEGLRIGLGFFINAAVNFFLILFSNKVKEEYKNSYLPIAYNLYFIGVLLNAVFIRSQLIGRLNYYFYGLNFIVGGFTLAYLYKRNKFAFAALLTLYICVFVATLYRMEENTALFKFFWDYV
ncbi:MAG: EpsG family protein [Bacteroidales bacterium]|nr:EpsG family protein [Bacteroidales bacterium]